MVVIRFHKFCLSPVRLLVLSSACLAIVCDAILTKSSTISPDDSQPAGTTTGQSALRGPENNKILDPLLRNLGESHGVMFAIIFGSVGLVICGAMFALFFFFNEQRWQHKRRWSRTKKKLQELDRQRADFEHGKYVQTSCAFCTIFNKIQCSFKFLCCSD